MHFEEAIKDERWIQAMDEEINSIERNDTWDLADLPKDKDCIGVKWVYKIKVNEKGEIGKYKVILVAKVSRLGIVRAILAIAAENMWKVSQMDVKSTFLNGILEEEVYVQQPLRYEIKGQENKVYKLKRLFMDLIKLQELGIEE